jgi:serine/threonine protein kinase/tetratricopeptide (TPR) repeat protein
MERTITCSHGHHWRVPADQTAPADADESCPVCNGLDADPPPPSERPTVVQAVRAALYRPTVSGTAGHGETPEESVDDVAGGPRAVPGYEILEELGRGGMGVVYKARQTVLDRIVALKMILTGPHAGPEARARFRAEARAAAGLRHPNIVQIYEVGEHDGLPYLALEYVEGGSLAQLLARHPLPPRQAAEVVEALARAVHHAHEHGIVHRDLKPANVLLVSGGVVSDEWSQDTTHHSPLTTHQPKVADFGLAKRLDDVTAATATGTAVGTPSYMAPEQAGAYGPADTPDTDRYHPAVDVYALGAILYEALTARPPFRGATPLETLEQVRSLEPVPPRRLQPAVPRDLETVCLKCLEKDPRKRYPTADALADDLHRFLRGEPIRARPVPRWERAWKWARRKPTAAALLAVSGLAVVLLILGAVWHQASLQEEVERAQTNEAEARRQQQRADEHYRQARQAMQRMVARLDDPRLGDVPRLQELREGQLEDALAFFQSILREGGPVEPAVQYDVAVALQHAGVIENKLARPEQARQNFRQAADLLENLTASHPDKLEYPAQLATCYNGLACCYPLSTPDAAHLLGRALKLREELGRAAPDNPRWQAALAESYHNLAQHLQSLPAESSASRAAYEKALAIRARLTQRYPKEPWYTLQATQDCVNLGLCYTAAGQPDLAEAVYRRGEALLKPVVAEHPEQPDYAASLAALYVNWAILMKVARNRSEQAARLNTRAIDLTEQVLHKEPRHGLAQYICRNAHGERAYNYSALGRYADAVKEWDRVIDLSAEAERPRCRALRAWDLLHAGDYAGAVQAARQLAQDPHLSSELVYEAAKLYGVAAKLALADHRSPSSRRAALAETYAAHAVTLLKRVQQAGGFKGAAEVRELHLESAFNRLRSRDDFRTLLREIEPKAPERGASAP